MNKINPIKILIFFSFIFIYSCTYVPLTERQQLIILGDDVLYPRSFEAFKKFKTNSKLIKHGKNYEDLQEITFRIKKS